MPVNPPIPIPGNAASGSNPGYTIGAAGHYELSEAVTVSAVDGVGIQGNNITSQTTLDLKGTVSSKDSVGITSASHAYTVTVDVNGKVSGGTDGIRLSDTAAAGTTPGGNTVTVKGKVEAGAGAGIWAKYSNNSIVVEAGGTVSAWGDAAISLSETNTASDGGGNTVTNKGLLQVFQFGIGIDARHSNNTITNVGTIEAPIGVYAGSAGSSNNKVVNTGSIISTVVGVVLWGNGSSLTNEGLIRTDAGEFCTPVSIYGSAGETVTVLNKGTMENPAFDAIMGNAEVDLITNQGTIIGGVALGSGNDLYDGRGGTIKGNVGLGDGNDTAYGGSGNEFLAGNGGNDFLSGGGGADVLNPFEILNPPGQDTVDGGAGIDTLELVADLSVLDTNAKVDLRSTKLQNVGVSWGSVKLSGIENVTTAQGRDLLIGDGHGNTFLSGDGKDTLEGGLGNDVLDGEAGFDFARFTGSAGAKVSLAIAKAQSTGYGVDTFRNIEGLTGGSGADRFTGNSQDNSFYGNAGHDTLSGGSGADTLYGGAGKDRLTGGSGKDVFVFNAKPSTVSNVDRITDFLRKDDTIQLENAIFKKLAKVGQLNKSFFVTGTKAKDKNDYIVYDKTKGALYYDADGSGQGAAVKIAQLNAKTVVGYNDFVVI